MGMITVLLIALAVSNVDIEEIFEAAGFWAGGTVVAIVLFFLTRKEYWKVRIYSGNYIYFLKFKPSASEVDQFVRNLYERAVNARDDEYR